MPSRYSSLGGPLTSPVSLKPSVLKIALIEALPPAVSAPTSARGNWQPIEFGSIIEQVAVLTGAPEVKNFAASADVTECGYGVPLRMHNIASKLCHWVRRMFALPNSGSGSSFLTLRVARGIRPRRPLPFWAQAAGPPRVQRVPIVA
jgi:hypothetical protein